jgi:hypothetical protein
MITWSWNPTCIADSSLSRLNMSTQSSLLLNAAVPQGSVLGPLVNLLYTAELPTWPESTAATFAKDTAVIATDNDPAIASHKLQTSLLTIQRWLKNWEGKPLVLSRLMSLSPLKETFSSVHIDDVQLFEVEDVKYLGLCLDSKLTGTNTSLQKGNN